MCTTAVNAGLAHRRTRARTYTRPTDARHRTGWVGRSLLSKVPEFTLNTYLRHCIGMYRACIGMYRGARPKSLCDDTIPVDTREIHHDTTYRTPAPSPPDPIHRYTLDTIQIQSIYMYLASRPLLAAASAALARPLCDHRRVSPLLGPLGLGLRPRRSSRRGESRHERRREGHRGDKSGRG